MKRTFTMLAASALVASLSTPVFAQLGTVGNPGPIGVGGGGNKGHGPGKMSPSHPKDSGNSPQQRDDENTSSTDASRSSQTTQRGPHNPPGPIVIRPAGPGEGPR